MSLGRVTFSMIGAYCEDCINELISRKIPLRDIRNSGNVIYAGTSVFAYPQIAKLSRRYGVRVRVTEKRGVYFHLSPFRKRPGLVLGTFVSAALVLTLRMFVWHIDIHGNSELTSDYMLKVLENYGFTAGVLANDTDALNAERNIMLSSDKIRWINIEVNGSRADVYMSETPDNETEPVDLMTPCNIVAARSGVITETNVTSGKLVCEKGSGAAEGSVLVSGFVGSGESLILVHADAEIIADFTENVSFSMDYTTVEKVPSGESFTRRQLMILGIVVPLDAGDISTENTVCTETTEQMRLFGFDIPLKVRTETYTGYRDVTVTRSPDDVRRLLGQQLEQYIRSFLNGYEVLDTVTEYSEINGGLELKATIKLRGDIAVKKPIYEH